jgi:hypothetical protein
LVKLVEVAQRMLGGGALASHSAFPSFSTSPHCLYPQRRSSRAWFELQVSSLAITPSREGGALFFSRGVAVSRLGEICSQYHVRDTRDFF